MFLVNYFRLFIAVALLSLLAGCSSTNQLYLESIKLAFFSDSPSVSLAQIKQSKADLLKVVHGERQPVYMALAFIEDDQLKWVSADKAILVFQDDKLIRTSGLGADLQYSSAFSHYNLSLNELVSESEWLYTIDVDERDYDLPMRSKWHVEAPESVEFYGSRFTVIPVREEVTTQVSEPNHSHEQSWTNVYWFDAASKQIIYSEQQASPYQSPFKFTFVSRIARLIDTSQESN